MSEEGDRLDVARIMVNHANIVKMHTGNIINWQMLKKKLIQTSAEELADTLQSALDYWLKTIDPMNIQEPINSIDITNKAIVKKLGKDKYKRDGLKISVKLFLTQWRADVVAQAVAQVCQELEIKHIDAVLVSFPFQGIDDDNNNIATTSELDKVKVIWNEMENLVTKGLISHLGVCDFDVNSLSELYKWAKVKPTMDQINMTNCCSAPEDLIEFSRENDIELLSHNDPIEILSARTFQKLLSDTTQDDGNKEWQPLYISRYSAIVRCRGIIEGKGYIVSAERNNTNTTEDYNNFF